MPITGVDLIHHGAESQIDAVLAEILEGTARQTVKEVPGLGSASTRWLVRGKQGSRLNFTVTTPSAGGDTRSVVLDGKGGQR